MGTFLCQNTSICLPQKNWCNQEIQCPYGDDEQNCCRFIYVFILIFHAKEKKKRKNDLYILLFARDTFVPANGSRVSKPPLSRSRNKLNLKFSYDVMTFLYTAHLLYINANPLLPPTSGANIKSLLCMQMIITVYWTGLAVTEIPKL